MEWRRFIKLYVLVILAVAALGAATLYAVIHRDELTGFHIQPDRIVKAGLQKAEKALKYCRTELPRLPGRISNGFKQMVRFIKTSSTDPEGELKASGLVYKKSGQ